MNTAYKITAALILFMPFTDNLVQAQSTMLKSLLTGEYYYNRLDSSRMSGNRYLFFHKIGHTVIGIDVQSLSKNPCFRGMVNQNSIINVTRIFPPYDPASKWEFLQGKALDLNHYRKIDRASTASDRAALLRCIQVFSK